VVSVLTARQVWNDLIFENGKDAYVTAFWWQEEYILPAILAVLEKQATQVKTEAEE